MPLLSGIAPEISIESLSRSLQKKLNSKKNDPFQILFTNNHSSALKTRYQKFLNRFPNAIWTISRGKDLRDGGPSLIIKIESVADKENTFYKLESVERIGFELINKKINDYEIISSYSILSGGSKPLPISLSIPNSVLTGTKYDFDIIFNEPINDAIIAGGLISLSQKQVNNNKNPKIELSPLAGGGLFKTVQAPLKAGTQYWAAILAHPEGLVSITKSVKIVQNKSDLIN